MKIVSQRTTMPFDNRSNGDYSSISPLSGKSTMPFNNVLTIQDIMEGRKNVGDFYPHGGGEWSPGEDVSKNYLREEADDYKRQERDMEILREMTDKKDRTQQEWKVKVPGGSKSFISFDLARKYVRENKLPFAYISRIAQKLEGEDKRVQVIADSLSKTFKVEATNYELGVIESGAAFCVNKNHFLTCAHVIKSYNKNQKQDPRDFLNAEVKLIQGGLRKEARIIDVDPLLDIALLMSDVDAEPMELDMEVSIGEEIIAIGSPHGFENNVSTGTVGSLNKKVYYYDGAPEYMFVDLSIFPGNSGGPIVKVSNGKFIGLVTLIVSAEGGYGLNAALPPQYIKNFLSKNLT